MTTSPSSSELLVPLAEHFHSIQGEGLWTGTAMHFLRFPGCTVGRSAAKNSSPLQLDRMGVDLPILPNGTGAKVCRAYNGEAFFCDTDYDLYESRGIDSLVAETWEDIVCFTGGEPVMHQERPWFKDLVIQLRSQGKQIHVETSGTILPTFNLSWLTVSPKLGWKPTVIRQAQQIKFLVTSDTKLKELDEIASFANTSRVYLSPIFDPNELVRANLERCYTIQRERPSWRIGCQWHKFIGAR